MSEGRTIDIGEVLGDAPLGWRTIVIVIVAFLVCALDGYDLLCMAFVAPALSRQLGMDVAAFGPIFSAAFLGIMIGGLVISPFGDRYGRKTILVGSVFAFGLFSALPIFDFSYSHLIAYRFFTGLGLGGAIPGALALTGEYAPRRSRGLCINLSCGGLSTGAVVGGLLAAKLIPIYGWQAAFWIASIGPLALSLLLLLAVPESITYLAATRQRPATIARILERFDPAIRPRANDHFIVAEPAQQDGNQIANLFRDDRGAGTLLLWLVTFAALFANAILASWLPAIMTRAGFSIQTGILGPVVMNLGGILGTVILGVLLTRAGAALVIAGGLTLTAVGTVLTGFALSAGTMVLPLIFFTGMFLLGSINSNNTLMTTFYPTRLRTTGTGWGLGIGRIGGAVGPAVGGFLLSGGFANETIFIATALVTAVGVIASLAIGARYTQHRQRPIANRMVARSH
jgi:AAHS family 4-hydroxybenzoate transporter-like MFS transporter